jgi:aminopeptidase N
MYDAVDPDTALSTRIDPDPDPDPDVAWERLAPQGEIIRFFSDLYGDYPFTTGGGIVDWAPNVGYALESQTRANYHRVPSASTVVHEIAHQWFGNAVTLEIWPDIWLNEGFATFSEWIYTERHGGQTAAQAFDELYAIPQSDPSFEDLWFPAPAALEHPRQLFHTPVYDRGAMTLQALREKVGNGQFFQIMRRWYAENKYGGASTEDFIDLSERIARRNLDAFFSVWLYEEGRPESW